MSSSAAKVIGLVTVAGGAAADDSRNTLQHMRCSADPSVDYPGQARLYIGEGLGDVTG
jgi:hypothetical protein